MSRPALRRVPGLSRG